MDIKKTLSLLLLAVLVISGVILGARVVHLMPQVQDEMQRTPTPAPPYGSVMVVTVDPSLPTPGPLIKLGAEGDHVKRLQERLAALGYYTGLVDGQFGNGTRSAVVLFQQQNGLDADGIAGNATLTLLYSDQALPFAVPETPVVTRSPEATAAPAMSVRKSYIRPDGLPLLVNRENLLPDGYQPCDLITMNGYCDAAIVKIKYANTLAEREAVDALMVMLRAAVSQGVTNWQISAAYRDLAYQKRLFDKQVSEYINKNGLSRADAISATRKTVADPGSSEHHLGTSFDITVPGTSFAGTPQAEWLARNCWDFGFILRYTKEKQSITGFLAEAWHFRYVGLEHSIIMRDENLCLEEYIDRYGVLIDP